MTYDPSDNARRSYAEAIEAMRLERLAHHRRRIVAALKWRGQ
jgi:hypothetical protein